MRATRFVTHVAARWRGRVMDESQDRSSERGDTLMEVLIALTILGIAGVALLAGFATAITSSGEHRSLASLDSSTRLAANTAIADLQTQAQNAATNPFDCNNSFTPTFPTLTGAFTVTATPSYWNGTTFQTSPCVSYAPQQYRLVVSSTTAGHSYSTTVTTVIYDPAAPPSPSNVTAPTKLVWLQQPATGVAGISISPQPEVAVEDASNNIVTSDFSSVTLQASGGTGTLSNTCFGAETYGIVQFSGCSFSKAGTYSVQAVDGTLTPTTPPASVHVIPAPAAKLVFTSAPLSATASSSAGSAVTVTEEDALGNLTTAAETVTLGTSSGGPSVFSATKNGAALSAPPTVTIPGGQSAVTFYYGDQVAGSPTLTASAPGLAPGSQVETINAGPPNKLAITSSPFTAPNTGTATTPFTIALEDSFGNLTSTTTATTVNLASSNGTGKFSASSTGSPTATSVKIAANSQSVTAYYGDTKTGQVTITVTSAPLTAASQNEQVVAAPTKLIFTTSPVAGNAGTTANLGPITVQEQTSTNVPTTVGETVNLTSSGAGTYIFNTASGASTPTGATSVTIPSGQSSVTFFYGGTKAGAPTITAAATGLTSATQTETVNVGPVAVFSLSNPGAQTAGTSFNETLTAQDAGGNTVTGFTGANCVTFSGPINAPGGNAPSYPAQGACPTGSSSVNFSNGVGTASITLFDAQSATLTATDGLIVGSTPSFTVSPGTASSFSLSAPAPVAGTSFTEAISAAGHLREYRHFLYRRQVRRVQRPVEFTQPHRAHLPEPGDLRHRVFLGHVQCRCGIGVDHAGRCAINDLDRDRRDGHRHQLSVHGGLRASRNPGRRQSRHTGCRDAVQHDDHGDRHLRQRVQRHADSDLLGTGELPERHRPHIPVVGGVHERQCVALHHSLRCTEHDAEGDLRRRERNLDLLHREPGRGRRLGRDVGSEPVRQRQQRLHQQARGHGDR